MGEARQQIRFCTASGGVRLAHATSVSGPPLVKPPNYLTHLHPAWPGPLRRRWLQAPAGPPPRVRCDTRGRGLSYRPVDDFSMAAWVDDLAAVVDALGLARFPLLGLSQGASVCIAYAAKHPERVSHLVLYGGYARGRFHRDLTP